MGSDCQTLEESTVEILDIGESRHATTNRYKHKPYCTRVPSCTYSTFRDVIHLIIRVLSSRGSFISNKYVSLFDHLLPG